MKGFLNAISMFLIMASAVAQQGEIRGTVVDNNNEPIPGVNVTVLGTKIGVQTNFEGLFEIKDVPNGSQEIKLSYIGFKTKNLLITVPSKNLKVVMYEGNELLQEVQVTGRNNQFSRKKTAYVSKLPLKDLENSQVYTTVTSELLDSQVVTNIDDALNNATGISKLWEATGRAPGEGTGYFASRGFATQPQLVDGMPGFTLSAVDPSYIERIEVVKGPSATLFGSTATSLGGLINVVTKKPYEGFGGSVSYTTGSFGTHRVSADINTPLAGKKGPYFRLNASYLTQDSFQDAGFRKTFFVAPSISYRVNNKLNFSFGLEYARTQQTNPSMLFLRKGIPLLAKNPEELNIDPSKSYTSNDIYLTSPTFNTRTIIDYKISDEWTSQSIFASSYSEANGFYQYNVDGGALAILQLNSLLTNPNLQSLSPIITPLVQPMLTEAGGLLQTDAFTRIFDKRDANASNYNFQQNFIGDFKIGELRNRLVVGLDFVSRSQHTRIQNGNPVITTTSNFPQLLGFFADPQSVLPSIPSNFVPALNATGQQVAGGFNALPYFDAFINAQGNVLNTSFTPGATYSPSAERLEQVFNQVPQVSSRTNSKTYAVYVSDVLNVTKDLTLNLGLRLDHFDQNGNENDPNDDYTKTTLSPKIGVVYQAIPNKLSVFSNYQTGFINVDPAINNDGSVTTFQPVRANQFEGGVKTNLFNGKLDLGASYYHITANDQTVTDPTSALIIDRIDLAETVSKGLEFEINANPFKGLNIRASYSYNDTKVTDATSIIGDRHVDELLNRRPEESGPSTIYNLWADYKFQQGTFLKNIGFGAGFNGASEHHTINNAITGQFTLPSYTVFNASAYYDAEKIRVGLKVNNLTDEVYYKGWSTINAQASRAFLGTLTYKF
ncbi:iron complex outermembrane recepter protein [Tenacibaculum sp. MAR_2009_124]|uniref:TonB-dependent receptor n=1 Tax=Tenacibaculum sp. MAR_2009_124 TaxID=1250059 RepID=UPI00089763B0|nr:TonB-dependent receptor [Tenacibaculum sp. MAR_2009_124]SEC51023.1 iron complex outermembrane recepter protein [Tenacibaculum sp. MAR_2009_124]